MHRNSPLKAWPQCAVFHHLAKQYREVCYLVIDAALKLQECYCHLRTLFQMMMMIPHHLLDCL